MKLEKAFAQVIRKHREKSGLSQHALAYEAEINRNNVSLYETGERLPSLATLFALCRALNVAPEKLIREINALDPEL